MSRGVTSLVVAGLVGIVVGLGLGALVFAREAPSLAVPAASTAAGQVAGSNPQDGRSADLDRSMARLAAAIERLAAVVVAPEPIARRTPEVAQRAGQPAALSESDVGAIRELEAQSPPANEAHLQELESVEREPSTRTKWLLLGESGTLRHFGTPARISTIQGSTLELWEYEFGAGKTRTIVLNRGRVIDIR